MCHIDKPKGFTLIELMIVIALIAVIASFAVPQFGRMIESNRVISTTNSIVGLINFSRSEAIRRGERVTVTAQNDTLATTLASDNSVIRQIEEAEGNISITDAAITFRANGLTTSAGDTTFTVCAGEATGRQIIVTKGGRVTSDGFACP